MSRIPSSTRSVFVVVTLLGLISLLPSYQLNSAAIPSGDGERTGIGVIINEVDSDQLSTDTAEFIELFDGGGGNTPLDGLVVVFYNGSNDLSYAAFDLDGFTTDVNGYFTLGNAAVPGVDRIFANGILQNGPDAVALFNASASDFPNGTPVTLTNLVDALVYSNTVGIDTELLALLNAGQLQVNEECFNDRSERFNAASSKRHRRRTQHQQLCTARSIAGRPQPGTDRGFRFSRGPGH